MSTASVGIKHSENLNPTVNIRQVPAGTIRTSPPPAFPCPPALDAGMKVGSITPPTGSKISSHHPPPGFSIINGSGGNIPPSFPAKSVPPAGHDSDGPRDLKPQQPNGPFPVGKKMLAPNMLPFPPSMMNVKGGKTMLQSPPVPPPPVPNRNVGGLKIMMRPPVSGDEHVKRPGILQPSSSLQTYNPSSSTAPSGQGSNSVTGLDLRSMDAKEGTNQMRLPPQKLGFPPSLTSNSLLNDSRNKVVHLTPPSTVPSNSSRSIPDPIPPSSTEEKVHIPIPLTDKPVMSIPGIASMSPERSSMQNITPLSQPGGKQSASPYIPNYPPGVPGSAPVNLGSKPSREAGGSEDSMEIPFQNSNTLKGSQEQPVARDGTDPIISRNPTDRTQTLSRTTLKESSLETNLNGAEAPPKPPRKSFKAKFSRFAELLVDSDEDSDEDLTSEANNAHTPGGGGVETAEEAHSGGKSPLNQVSEDTLFAVAEDHPQMGEIMNAKEVDHEVAMEAQTTETEDRAPCTGKDDTKFRESEIPSGPSEPPALLVHNASEPKISSSGRSLSILSTSRPPLVSKTQSNSRVDKCSRSDTTNTHERVIKAGKRTPSEASRALSAPKRKINPQTVSNKPNKEDSTLKSRKDSTGCNLPTKPTAHHSSTPLLANMGSSENTAEQKKKSTAAAESSQSVRDFPKQGQATESTRTLSENSDDLDTDELVSSTTLPSDKDRKEKVPRCRRPSPLSNFKTSDLYHLYHMLRELDDRKDAHRQSRGRVHRKGKTPPNSRDTSPKIWGRTPSQQRHRVNYTGSDDNDDGNSDWEPRGNTPHLRWSEHGNRPQRKETSQRDGSTRAPWRCGIRATVSNGFAPPSPLRRPLGYINIGGGFYERVGYSPYVQRRLRHSSSPHDASIDHEGDFHGTMRDVLKDGDVREIMRNQGQAAVLAAQFDPLCQNSALRRADAGVGSASPVRFLDLPPQKRWPSMDSDRLYPPDSKMCRGSSRVDGSPPQVNRDLSHPYCTSARRARLLISPDPLADNNCETPVTSPLTDAKHLGRGGIAPDLIMDAGKALDAFLRKASGQTQEKVYTSNTDSKLSGRRTSNFGYNAYGKARTHLKGEGYTKHASIFPESSRKNSLYPRKGEYPADLGRERSAQYRRPKHSDDYTPTNTMKRAWSVGGVSFRKTSAHDRAQPLRNYSSDREKKKFQDINCEMNPHSSQLHLGKVCSAADNDSYSHPQNRRPSGEHNVADYDSSDDLTKKPMGNDAATRQVPLRGKSFTASLHSSGRSQKGYLDAAAKSLLRQRSTTEAINSFTHPLEIAKARIRSQGSSTALPEQDLREHEHQGGSRATPNRNSFLSAAARTDMRKEGITGSKKRSASVPDVRATPMASANVQHDPFSRIASRPNRRKDNFAQARGTICSEWVDEVLSSVLHLKGSASVEASKADSSMDKGLAAKASQYADIPLIDMRREFKPITSEDLAKGSVSRGGHLSARSHNRLNNGGMGSVDDSGLRPHIPTIHFKTMPGSRVARTTSAAHQSPHENSISTWGKNPTNARDRVRRVIVNVPNGMPYEAYSTIKVKNPEQPSPWARAPSVRRGLSELPGRPVAQRILTLSTPTESEGSETPRMMSAGDTAPVASERGAGRRLIQELYLDDYRRPYIVLKEVRTGAAAKEQRQSVERLSRPKPIFLRPEES